MQIWFFFEAGTGGDGVTNLIERASNFVAYDGETDWWRIHRIVNSSPKFYAPTPDVQGCFRSNQAFGLQRNQLNTGYKNCVLASQNCVVASHDVTLQYLDSSDCQDVFRQDQIKVLLVNNNSQTSINATIKNLMPVLPSKVEPLAIDQSKFDFVLDVEKIQADWNYVNDFCQTVGADLDQEQHCQYQDILTGSKTYMTNNFNVEEYTSVITNNTITYKLVNVWQSVAN